MSLYVFVDWLRIEKSIYKELYSYICCLQCEVLPEESNFIFQLQIINYSKKISISKVLSILTHSSLFGIEYGAEINSKDKQIALWIYHYLI